jgi:DNA-binding response OmpR family regulator
MAKPTIERRLERKFILMTADAEMRAALQARVPSGWEMVVATDLDDIGDWAEILLYRFLLLDLDEVDAFDPLDVIRALRMQHQVNIAVFCFGGDQDIRDEMRLNRADRFYEREQIAAMLPQFLEQYGWGGTQ